MAEKTTPQKPSSWLSPLLKPMRPLFREVLAISLFVNVLALAVPVFVLQVYDRVVFHAGLSTLQGLVIGMGIVLIFDFILRQTRTAVMRSVALRIDVHTGRRLFAKVMALPLRTLEGRPVGYWQTLFRDLDTVRNTLSGASALLVFDLPFALLFLGLVYIIAQPLFWVLLVALFAFLTLAVLSGRSVSAASTREKRLQQSRDSMLAETIMGRGTIKSLALTRLMEPRWEAQQADTITQSVERGSLNDRYVNLAHVMTMATTVLMTTVGALAVINLEMTIGGLIAANMLSGRLLAPLNQLVGTWRSFAGFRQSVERLGGLFDETEDRQASALVHERPKGLLTLENVSFHYRPGSKPVIHGLTHTFPPGSLTGIIGRNGCGKSTLLKLMLNLYPPDEGRVLLDGGDITQFGREDLARWIGYVPQDTVLFSGTLKETIAQGATTPSDEAIIRAAKLAGVHGYILDLPDGYDTAIGESGGLLSGGVRQRLAIARALVGDPPILLFDEPSGSLDRQTEEHLATTLAELAQTRTVVIVTHSATLLTRCQSIVMIEAGKIIAKGPAQEILKRLNRPAAPPTPPAPPASSPQTTPAAGSIQFIPAPGGKTP